MARYSTNKPAPAADLRASAEQLDKVAEAAQRFAPEHPPEAKAAHCERCDSRAVLLGRPFCAECIAAEAKRRKSPAGFTRCRCVGGVCAVGQVIENDETVPDYFRSTFSDGEVAEFADADVLSLPGVLVPVE